MVISLLKLTLFGIVEGVTEWLPISSTGHLILLEKYIHLNLNESIKEFFLVFIQLGAVMAVVSKYFSRLNPFYINKSIKIRKDKITLWFKIGIACIPVGIIGLLFDEEINKKFYNEKTVAISLIIVGIIFLFAERLIKKRKNDEITYKSAITIGAFQVFSAVFPGVSRSGSTILVANIIGHSKKTATEFSFYLAIPIMLGASVLKLIKMLNNNIAISIQEWSILLYSALVAYLVSILIIKFLTSFVKKHSLKIFGFYRIFLGFLILLLI